jgi:excisionase family DNA binding protein
MDKLAYSPEETARLIGVSRATIYRMIEKGTLPYKRIKAIGKGRRERIIIPTSALEKWLSQADEPRRVTIEKRAAQIAKDAVKKKWA